MANELVAELRPRDFMRANGPLSMVDVAPIGVLGGLRLLKSDTSGFYALIRVPANLTVGTGYTAKALVVDDGADAADPGKVIVVGATLKVLASGTDYATFASDDIGTETTASVTLDATAGQVVEGSLAVANANADSVGAGSWAIVRVRRIGTNASDTCLGTAILLGVHILNT